MQQLDLWRYPNSAGFKAHGTSQDAAHAIENTKAPSLREQALTIFKTGAFRTADEIAFDLGCSILTARPRCAELHARGLITDSGARRISDGGKPSIVWRLA